MQVPRHTLSPWNNSKISKIASMKNYHGNSYNCNHNWNYVKWECKFHTSFIRRDNACGQKSPRKQKSYLKNLIHQITSLLNGCEDAMHLHLLLARIISNEICTPNEYSATIKKNTHKNKEAHTHNNHRPRRISCNHVPHFQEHRN